MKRYILFGMLSRLGYLVIRWDSQFARKGMRPQLRCVTLTHTHTHTRAVLASRA